MRKFTLSNTWYSDYNNIFKNNTLEVNTGITVLVGCNGIGKTTLLHQIKENLKDNDIPVCSYNFFEDDEKKMRQKYLANGETRKLANFVTSSEGERITYIACDLFYKIGRMINENPNSKEYWVLVDAIDSGLSIDGIIEVKESIGTVLEENKDKDMYFLISTNSYELARKEKCLMVENGKYTRFFSYEDYRNYILDSRDYKNKRDGG